MVGLFYFIDMIQGRKKVNLDIESILNKISEYDIYKMYMPHQNWQVNSVTYSPFRDERTPSFLISYNNGQLRFIDFGEIDEASYLIDKKDDLINLLESANPILTGSFQIIEKNKLDSTDFPGFNLIINGKDAQFSFRSSMTDSLTRYFAMNLDCISDISPQALSSKLNQLLKSKFNEK